MGSEVPGSGFKGSEVPGSRVQGFSVAAGQKNGRSNREKETFLPW
jgi:hypothetical protein